MTQTLAPEKKRRSESLTKPEYAALKKYRLLYDKEVDCAISIGIDRTVLNRILTMGSGHPDKIKLVRAAIGG